jgi:O-6-methylguanine DNA methyltransferase
VNELHVELMDGVWFGVACDEQRVFATSFAGDSEKALRCLLDSVPFNMPFRVSAGSAFAVKVLTLVKRIYDGEDASPKVALATEHLPAYTQKVLRTVSLIPAGYVSTYGSVAEAAGGGARAVGNVMAANPFAPIVPCHRVVSANFALGGYGGGLDLKVALLKREKRGYSEKREIPVDAQKLQVFPVEFVLRKIKEN